MGSGISKRKKSCHGKGKEGTDAPRSDAASSEDANTKQTNHSSPGEVQQYDQKGSLNFATNFRDFDDIGLDSNLKDGISSEKIKISEITGYTYGNGLYFCGVVLTYEIDGVKIRGPEYVIDKAWPKTLSLEPNEKIVEIGLQHGEITDQLWVRTNLGNMEEWGGKGGIEQIYPVADDYTLMGFAGKQGYWRARRNVMNTFGPILIGLGKPTELSTEDLNGELSRWISKTSKQLDDSVAPIDLEKCDIEDSSDRSVLEILLQSCGMPCHGKDVTKKNLDHWGSRIPIGQWEGVVVNEEGRVRELYLEKCGLTGPLPDALGNLSCLEELWMPMNNFTGNLPVALANCTKLRTVNLHGNLEMKGFVPKELLDISGLIFYIHNTDLVSNKVSLEVPSFNFHVILRDELLKLDRLIPHEEAMEKKGLMTYLGPERTFTKWFGGTTKDGVRREEIAFISHRWLEPNLPHPDCQNNTKLNHIKHLLNENPQIKFVWMDFLCVPQAYDNRHKQMAAINSLPNYIKSCGNVFILCGNEGESRYEVYSGRGWCRLERLCASITVFGQDPDAHMYSEANYEVRTDIYVCNKDTKACDKLDPSVLLVEGSEYDPMGGFFFDESDKNKIAPCMDLLAKYLEAGSDETLKGMGHHLRESAAAYL